ncbi:MAG: TolC family protein [Xanthomonadales bacterium]|nr:TolC family protein [Xanthomonadales bacterium]
MQRIRPLKIPIANRFLNAKKSLLVSGLFATLLANAYAAEPIAAPRHPLTEAASIRLALARPALQALNDARLALARSEVTQAGRWSNPTFEYSREELDRATGDSTDEFYWLSQRFEISGERSLRKRAAEERVGAADLATDAARMEIEAATRTLFYRVLQQQARLGIIEVWTDRMSTIEAVVHKREVAGDVSGYDALRLSTERASALATLGRERAHYRRLWAELSAVLGGAGVVAPHDGVAGTLLPTPPPPLDDLLAGLQLRPDIAQFQRDAAAAELERRAGTRGWVPELTLGVGRKVVDDGLSRDSGSDSGRDSGPMVSAGITIPLFDRGQSQQQRGAAQATIARSEFELALAGAKGEVRGRWQEVNELIATAQSQRHDVRVEANRLIEIAEAGYRGGELGVLELLDAYRGAHEAELLAVSIAAAARQARIELDRLTGGPT